MFKSIASNRLAGAAAAAALLVATAVSAHTTFVGAEYLKEASVSLEAARAAALKSFPGHIVDQELEREAGGSGLRYSFDIEHGGSTHEVGVDAKTGAVLENSEEGPNAD